MALSFSNIQFAYQLPLIFVGLAFKTNQLHQLSSVHTKEYLFPNHPYDLPKFDLSQLETELKAHKKDIIESKVVELRKPPDYQGDIEGTLKLFLDGYLKTINQILSSNLLISSEGIDTCFVHEPITKEGVRIPLQSTLFSSHPIYKRYKLIAQSKNNFNNIMHLTRLFATNEYLKKRRIVRRFVYGYVRDERDNLRQVVRILWQSPNIQNYADSFVGHPEILFNTVSGAEKTPLMLGKRVNIFPITHFCLGTIDEMDNFRSKVTSCVQSSNRRPFGAIVSAGRSFEGCTCCYKKSQHIRCISKKPKCDGSLILCGNDVFAGNICNGNFSIYISIFSDVLKVGRSILSRTIGRLLEQSAFDGLVFYPVNSLYFAHFLEREIAKYLKSKIRNLNPFGIKKVKTIVTTDERFGHIRSLMAHNSADGREHIYDEVKRLLDQSNLPHIQALVSSESTRVKLTRNWLFSKSLDVNRTELVTDLHFKRIKGEIEGIIGYFLFLDEKAYSLKSLQGYVIECQ